MKIKGTASKMPSQPKVDGWDLSFFNSGEWQVCDERLKDLEKINRKIGRDGYNPGRASLFKALKIISQDEVRVCIMGQDPYPDGKYATGVAFSIPDTFRQDEFPPTLSTFLKEYSTDLRLPIPNSGNLDKWTQSGVLLWNAIPSCLPGRSLSHDWPEWRLLTQEIVETLAKKGIAFALLGQVARSYSRYINLANNCVICTSHPSPRGSYASKTPFIGSRLFSTLNDHLNYLGLDTVDWKLP